jgi:hypothetical protein
VDPTPIVTEETLKSFLNARCHVVSATDAVAEKPGPMNSERPIVIPRRLLSRAFLNALQRLPDRRRMVAQPRTGA